MGSGKVAVANREPGAACLEGGRHACLIYHSEHERRRAMAEFVESGLRSGERVVYLADGKERSERHSLLASLGIPSVDSRAADRFEVGEAESVYCPEGTFDPEDMLDFIRRTLSETEEAGFARLWATGGMGWALRGITGSDRLMEYESRVNEFMDDESFCAVCQYDARLFDGPTLYHVLQTHPYIFSKGRMRENSCYIGAGRDARKP